MNEKYRQFRNYMTNELGITRQDIETWTKQSVANEVEKLIGQMNIENLATEAINRVAKSTVTGSSFGAGNGSRELRESLANQLAKRVEIKLKEDDN